MKRASMTVLAAAMLLAMAATAQNPPAMPKPGPEVEKLKYFLGNWKQTGEVKPGPMGPGGKVTGTQNGVLMPGGFYIEVHGTGDAPGYGKFTSTAYLGYDPQEKTYTYDEFDSTGEHTVAKGTFEGDTWTWTNEVKMGGKVMKGRYTEKINSPTSYDYKYEASIDGGEYTTFMEGKATKAGGAAKGKPAAAKSPAAKTSAANDAGTPKSK
jgi:hypothetical protein